MAVGAGARSQRASCVEEPVAFYLLGLVGCSAMYFPGFSGLRGILPVLIVTAIAITIKKLIAARKCLRVFVASPSRKDR